MIENLCPEHPQQGTLESWTWALSALRCLEESLSTNELRYIISRALNSQCVKVSIQSDSEIALYFLYTFQNTRYSLYRGVSLECDRYLFDSLKCQFQSAKNSRATCPSHRQGLGSFLILFLLDMIFQLCHSINWE